MPAHIKVYPNTSEITGYNLPHKEIVRVCSYFVPNAIYSPKFKSGHWNGVVNLYRNATFPTGLLGDVISVLEKARLNTTVEYMYDYPERKYDWALNPSVLTRERHMEAIAAFLAKKRGMMQLPTRFGKTTVVASGTIAALGVNTLFIAHQLDLIYDAKKIFETFIGGVGEIGVIGGGEKTFKPVTVACIDSLALHKDDPLIKRYLEDKVKYLIVDETQFYGPGQYKDVVKLCNAPYRLFMSATVDRNDGAALEIKAASGDMMYELTEQEMISEGYISDVFVDMIPFDHRLYNEKATGIKYPEFYTESIVQNDGRNKLITDLVLECLKGGNPTLVIVTRIEHGKILREMLASAGVKVEFIWGDTAEIPIADRIRIREEFNAGKYDVLIGSTIFDTAIDLHRASALVLAGSGSSKIRAPQRVGRILSHHMGKKAICKDIDDRNIKYFAEDAKDRYRVYLERYGDSRVRRGGKKWELMMDNLL